MDLHEGTIDAGGAVRLFYRSAGSGPETVVVIHGGPGFSMGYIVDDMLPLAREHRVVFYDPRGTGRSTLVSDAAALDAQRSVSDLEALREHFGLPRLTLLGHSWGAGVAALYAARHPDRVQRLIVVGAIPLRRSDLTETFRSIAAGRSAAERAQLKQASEAWVADAGSTSACRAYYDLWFRPFYGDPAARARSQGDFCAGTPASLRNKVEAVDRFTLPSLGDYDWRPALRELKAPTLVVHGSVDAIPVASAREWAAAPADARLLLLEGVGHFPYVEVPEQFFAAVSEFVKGRWPQGAGAQGQAVMHKGSGRAR